MADMTTIKGKIKDTIYPNGTGAITAEKHQSLLLDVVDNINEVKQDVLVSGQNIRPLVSGESLLGSAALNVLGTKFIYDLDKQQLFAMIDGAQQDFHIWIANRAVHSQVAQVIEIQKEGYFKELVPLTIKNKAGLAVLCWEYDGMIYEASMEDNVLTVVSKPKGDEFDKQGNYPLLHVGTADDLAGRGESVPASFGFRASGGKSIKDGRAYIKRIKGNSVVWNQLVPKNYFSEGEKNGVTFTIEGAAVVLNGTVEKDFEYQVGAAQKIGIINTHKYAILGGEINKATYNIYDSALIGGSGRSNSIFAAIGTGLPTQRIYCYSGQTFTNYKIYPCLIDLTKLFQAGNEPSTIEEFNARVATLGVDMNAYNEGEVIHCNTESIKSVGDNAWDEEWENGTFNTTTGDNMNTNIANKSIRSKNLIPIKGGEAYYCNEEMWIILYDLEKKVIPLPNVTATISGNSFYVVKQNFILPKNAAYMRFYLLTTYGTTYNHDIMISLVHSGWKQDTDAGYQPYWQDTLPLPIIRKYFPDGMKSAGTAHDEIRYNKASGKWEYSKGRIKSVDLGDYDWVIREYNGLSCFSARQISIGATWDGQTHNFICAKYSCVGGAEIFAGNDKSLSLNNGYFGNQDYKDHIVIRDTSYTDVATFKADMAGVILYYESNDWEWVELDEADQNFRDYYQVADFGTEMSQSQSNVPSAPFSADIIYQFNAVDMIREHELEITELQNVIATMQAQLTALTNGGQ